MSTTTVRLDEDDERLLDKLAPEFGGRSSAIRSALRFLADDIDRREALSSFLKTWESDSGPVDDGAVEAMATKYNL